MAENFKVSDLKIKKIIKRDWSLDGCRVETISTKQFKNVIENKQANLAFRNATVQTFVRKQFISMALRKTKN